MILNSNFANIVLSNDKIVVKFVLSCEKMHMALFPYIIMGYTSTRLKVHHQIWRLFAGINPYCAENNTSILYGSSELTHESGIR